MTFSRNTAGTLGGKLDQDFFLLYSGTSALYRSSRKPGQAIQLFHQSRSKLERELRSVKSRDQMHDYATVRHSLQALIHWLFPNYIGYNRLANAKLMYQHAAAATSTSRSELSIPYIVGLMVQLRIAPFLIKTKNLKERQLERIRAIAIKLIENNRENVELSGHLGILEDGLGFSYFLYERDPEKALVHLVRATEYLLHREKTLVTFASKNDFTMHKVQLNFLRAMLATAHWDCGICFESKSENSQGEQMLNLLKETRHYYQQAYECAKHTSWDIYKAMSAHNLAGTYAKEASLQLERKSVVEFLRRAVDLGEESLRWFSLWSPFEADFLGGSWIATFCQQLANYSESTKRKRLMNRSLELAHRAEQIVSNKKIGLVRYKLVNIGDIFFHNSEYYRNLAMQTKKSEETQVNTPIAMLREALENCLSSRTYYRDQAYRNRLIESSLLAGDICYELMCLESDETKKGYSISTKRYFDEALRLSIQVKSNERVAEAYWRIAQVLDKDGDFRKSAACYMRAHEAYNSVGESPEIRTIYSGPSDYMLAWSWIEEAKLRHRASEFDKASEMYRDAANLITRTRRWHSRANLYFAESLIEKSEKESLAENTQSAIQGFLDAVQALTKLQNELRNDDIEDSKSFIDLATRMTSFCNARVMLEKSKDAYKVGDTEQSIEELTAAEQIFFELSEVSEASDSLGSNELSSLSSLCKALIRFQSAQMSGNSELYLEAEGIFGRAAEISKSKSLRPLLMGLSNFATFLYYSKQIEETLHSSLDVAMLLECNKALESAELAFKKLGNKSFLNMLKASKHILDATMKMNAAEREMGSPSTKARLYGNAQRSLSRASKYYQLLGSSARVKGALQMIGAVRNHQKLIPLAHDIIAEVASNQIIYAAISNSTVFDQSPENSARDLEAAFIVLDVNTKPFLQLNETTAIEITLSNMGKGEAVTVRIDEAIPEGLDFLENSRYTVKDRSLLFSSRIGPGFSNRITLFAKAQSTGEFTWHPTLVYLGTERIYKISRAKTVRIVVESDKLADVTAILEDKKRLEEELRQVEVTNDPTNEQTRAERRYSIKESISKIEENLFRLRNEYDKMTLQLEQIRSELTVLSSQAEALDMKERIDLESEEKLLVERIGRRRSLLEQAQLL